MEKNPFANQLWLWKNLWLGRESNTDQTAHEPLPAEMLTTELLEPSILILDYLSTDC